MKIVHITYSATGGAGIAAYRLHKSLINNEIKSSFISINLTTDFSGQQIEDPFLKYKKPSIVNRLFNKLKRVLLLTKKQRVVRSFTKIKPQLNFEIVSLPFSNYKLHKHPLVKEADIINLHWVSGIIDYPTFFKKCKKPIVWTLHDMNPIQGLFHYKNDKVENFNISNKLDLELEKIKKEAIKNIEKGVIVTPSKWLFNEVVTSIFFKNFKFKQIANSIPHHIFKPQNKNIFRKKYQLPIDKFVLLFATDSLNNKRKGLDILIESLKYLEDLPIVIVSVGKGKLELKTTLKSINVGSITTEVQMAEMYALSDVFVLPSREDNLPNVMLESFSCGKPVVGFNVGGISEHIHNFETGIIAEHINAKSLAKALRKYYNSKEKFNEVKIRNYFLKKFNESLQAEKYIKLYKSL
ncbi:glycosyltransferase [Lutibacter aestuarii]|uniref:Glycosyltransferase n=1 Tax=Lutibacter aestuarii TaxID=861111 RepID=A0ABW2ZB39_9FLAO